MIFRINILFASLLIFFISSTSLSQTDTSKADSTVFRFDPKFYSVQVEACVLGLGVEIGGLVDVDLLQQQRSTDAFYWSETRRRALCL